MLGSNVEHPGHLLAVDARWLLQQHMHASFDGLGGKSWMLEVRDGDHHSVHLTRVEHLDVVGEQRHTQPGSGGGVILV